MKYAVWFVRLLFAAWMIPAGLNHFVPLFPQPMGSQPLSMELIVALLDSHLFDLVKGVELIAGIGVLFGFYTPLALLICMPVSFGVFYWDAPLEGWGSIAAFFGYATLLCNTLLCLAWYKSYRSMFTVRARPSGGSQLVMIGRIVFGAWMVLYAANVLFLSLWPAPAGTEPLAEQLMTSLINSRLLHVALTMQLIAGILILAGMLVPLALCVQMSISTCALFWALILDQQPLGAVLTLAAFALNGLLMLAYLPYYRDILQRHSLAAGEDAEPTSYDGLFVDPKGRTSRAPFLPALIVVVAAILFYGYVVTGRTAEFCMLVLLYPLFTLLTRRIRDMGQSPWLVLAPLVLMLVTLGFRLDYLDLGAATDTALTWIAVAVTAAFAVWGSASKGKPPSPSAA
jgi:putative oxidoreductase